MEHLSKQILADYQVRKTTKQKTQFIEFLSNELSKSGIRLTIEQGGLVNSRNLIVGDVEKAKVLYTAHYDTAPRLPFPNFITPQNMLVYGLIMFGIGLLFFVILVFFEVLLLFMTGHSSIPRIFPYIMTIGVCTLMLFGPANKHTANDNTSGVITLVETMLAMSEEQRSAAAFVFFDHEEIGLFGSHYFAKQHRKHLVNTPVINFDCVSDGDTILLITKPAIEKQIRTQLIECYPSTKQKEVIVTSQKGTFYPSDQRQFKTGIGVAAFRKKRWIGLYLSRIHTMKDTILQEENIELLKTGNLRLTDCLIADNSTL